MSRPPILAAVVLLALLPAAPAAPVPAAKPDDPPVSAFTARLLRFRSVERELKMSAEQRIAMVDALEDNDEAVQKAFDAREGLAPRKALLDRMEEERMKGIARVFADTAGKGLTPAQRARLRQVDLQVRGPAALADPAVQKGLDLTDAQKKAATVLVKKAMALADEYVENGGPRRAGEAALRKEVVDFRAEAVKEFAGGLTADQRATWKAMLGDPVKGFDVDDLWIEVIMDPAFEWAPGK